MKKLLLLLTCLASLFKSNSQTTFIKLLGDSAYNLTAGKVIPTSDGGSLSCNILYTNNNDFAGSLLMKLDSNGDTTWTTIFNDSIELILSSVAELHSQGGYIVCGGGRSVLHDQDQLAVLCKIDLNGNVSWVKAYSEDTTIHSGFSDVVCTPDDSIIAVGTNLMKADSSGNPLWARNNIIGSRLQLTQQDELLILCGDMDLLKFNLYGEFVWAKSYHQNTGPLFFSFIDADTSGDGHYILTASSINLWSPNEGFQFYFKVNVSGNVAWARMTNAGMISQPTSTCIFPLEGNTYGLICTNWYEFGGKLFVMTTDSVGIPVTTRVDTSFQPTNYTILKHAKTFNNQQLFSMTNYDSTTMKYDSRIVLADSIGNTYCNMADTTVIVLDTILVNPSTFMPSTITVNSDTITMQVYNALFDTRKGISTIETECLTTVAVAEEEFLNDIALFPNPTTGSFSLKYSSFHNKMQLQVFNILGKVVFSKTFLAGDHLSIDLRFEKGLYFVRVTNGKSEVVRKLIIE